MDDRNHLQGRLARRMAMLATAMLLLLVTIFGAAALDISAPSAVPEGQQLSVSATGAGQVIIALNGIIIASGSGSASNTIATNSSSAGTATYTFSDDTQNQTRTVQILEMPLAMTVASPQTDAFTQDVTYSVTTNWPAELCYVQIDGAGHTLDAINPTTFSAVIGTADGVHTIDFKCKLGTELPTLTRSLHVDTMAPKITAASPTGEVSGQFVKLTVDTDEIAQCRYGESEASFDALGSSFGTTYATRNEITVPAAQGPYTYFVRCKDVYGNAMASSTIISFLNKLPPTATVDISGTEPYKAGTYEVKVKTSAPMLAMPKVTYTFQESARQQQVALSGADDEWSGFLIIPADLADTVVSFAFEGQSRDGVAGSAITSKSIFTIDAKAPAPVDAITVDNSSAAIRLRWFSTDSSEIDSYNIYRADHEGVAYTDKYSSSRTTEFLDSDAHGARYYYYKVAPVDGAGNIGDLSAEVYGSAVDEQLKDVTGDPLLSAKLDEEISSTMAMLLDANATLSALEGEGNPATVQVINDMDLITKGREVVASLQASIESMKDLQMVGPTAEDVDNEIIQSRAVVNEARHKLIRKVVPQEQTDATQPSDNAGLERSLPYALLGQNVSERDKTAYLRTATQLQDGLTVKTTAMSFRLYDLSGTEQDYTFVRKSIALNNPSGQVSLIEHIPKTVAQDVSEVTFSETPVVLEDDPVVMYSLPVLEQHEFTYYVNRLVSLDEVKKSRTYVYPAIAAPPADNLLTGKATAVELPFVPSTDLTLIVVGVLVIIALGAYYVSLSSEKPFKTAPKDIARKFVPPEKPTAKRSFVRRRIVQQPLPERLNTDNLVLPPTHDGLKAMLADAESYIDRKDYDHALAIYREALDHLGKDQALEAQLSEQTMHVYSKLLLFKRLNDAGAAIEANDKAALKKALEDVSRIAAELGEQQTVLITEAKSSYARFVQSLNRLEIEHTENY